MSNYTLTALSPLGATEPQIDSIGDVTITEVINQSLASISPRQGKEKEFSTVAKMAFKIVSLPSPGMSITAGELTLFWSGPEQYFVEAPEATHDDIVSILKPVFKESASITEQSGGWCRFDVEGENAIRLLERICAVDTMKMETGSATRSVIEHIGIFMLCRSVGNHFSIYGPRSSAGSLHHALTTAAKSVA